MSETTRPERNTMSAEKIRENRLRRAAGRQGLMLAKSRSRDPRALGYGTYGLCDASTRGLVLGDGQVLSGYGCDLDEIDAWLNGTHPIQVEAATKGESSRAATADQSRAATMVGR